MVVLQKIQQKLTSIHSYGNALTTSTSVSVDTWMSPECHWLQLGQTPVINQYVDRDKKEHDVL